MATSTIKHCRVAQESTYGSPDSDGLPSTSGLSFKALEFDGAGVTYAGDAISDDRAADARCAPFALPPEPATMWSGGSRVQHRIGDISLTVYPRGVGAASVYSRPSEMPWFQLVETALKVAEAVAASDTASGVSPSSLTVTTPAFWATGSLIAVEIAGRLEVSSVVDMAGAIATLSPALSATIGAATSVRFMDTLYFADDFTAGPSVCLEMMTADAKILAFGCRLTSMGAKVEEGQLKLDLTLNSGHIEESRPPSTVLCPDYSDGARPHLEGSFAVYSAAVTGTAPISLARNVALVDRNSTTVSVSVTQAPTGYAGSLLAAADMEATELMAEAALKLRTPSTDFDTDFWEQTRRNLMLGFGPSGAGNGIAIMMGGAFLTADGSKRSEDSSQWNQELAFKAGRWEGDNDSAALCNSAFRLGAVR